MHNTLWFATANISPFRELNATSSHNQKYKTLTCFDMFLVGRKHYTNNPTAPNFVNLKITLLVARAFCNLKIVSLGFLRTWFLMFSDTLVAILSVSIVLMVKLLGIKLAVEGKDLL